MTPQYHILNGDALRERFPKDIEGDIIVARECLVVGDVTGKSLPELYASRARFLSENYGGTQEQYQEKVVQEFEKLADLPADSAVHLWFEDDLFCQVNFWFVIHLLVSANYQGDIYLVRPSSHTEYGFGGLNQEELRLVYQDKIALQQLDHLAMLWPAYQAHNHKSMLSTAQKVQHLYPFILPAIEAHVDRQLTTNQPGRPTLSLIKIMEEVGSDDFGKVFKEFCKRESIYGFGDLQVKTLYDEIIAARPKT